MIAGIVHRDPANGTFWFDDRPVRGTSELPTSRAWQGTLWFAAKGITPRQWANLMRPEDVAFGASPGTVSGVKFACGTKGRKMRVVDSSCWGVETRDPNLCSHELQSLYAAARACDIRPRNSAGATAMGLYTDLFNGKDGRLALTQLPPRWRGLPHAAMHQGPIAVLKGGLPNAVHIDVKQAYLAALFEDVPVLGIEGDAKTGGYHTHEDLRWSVIRDHVGFVDAIVDVYGDRRDQEGLPPLPIHTDSGVLFPTGTLRGVWTIATVREAEDRGELNVLAVKQFSFAAQTRPLFAELAETFLGLPATLSKRLYTRFWGKLASSGGYQAIKSDHPIENAVPHSGLWWSYDGIDPYSHKARPTYRPDLAAFIVAHNQRNVFRAIRTLKPKSVAYVHLDALWTNDFEGAARLCEDEDRAGVFREKSQGPLRVYGTGAYTHGEHIACSGYDPMERGPLTPASLEKFLGADATFAQRRAILNQRTWFGDPALTPDAISKPRDLGDDWSGLSWCPTGPTVYDDLWTPSGWVNPEHLPDAMNDDLDDEDDFASAAK